MERVELEVEERLTLHPLLLEMVETEPMVQTEPLEVVEEELIAPLTELTEADTEETETLITLLEAVEVVAAMAMVKMFHHHKLEMVDLDIHLAVKAEVNQLEPQLEATHPQHHLAEQQTH